MNVAILDDFSEIYLPQVFAQVLHKLQPQFNQKLTATFADVNALY
jgi:hypothetical protein